MKHLTILQINDLHGYLAPHPEMFVLRDSEDIRPGGGLARIATLFNSIRRERAGAVLALDSGDTFHGTMAAVHTRGEALIAPMQALHLDAMTAHWEFAYGLAGVEQIVRRLPYPLLAANFHARGSTLEFRPFTIVERGGVKVAIIGLSAIVAAQLLPRDERSSIEMTIGEAELQAIIPSIRRDRQIDLVVVLSHLGFPQDCKLAAVVPGIDVLVSGHTHNRLDRPAVVNGTIIMQSGAHGSFVGRLDLTLADDGVAEWSHALIAVDDSIEADAEMNALVTDALRPFAGARTEVIGETTCDLHRYAMFESTMDNLLLEATATAADADVALSNAWRYGAPIPAGPLTEWDLWSIVPANPQVSIVTLTGRELHELFEQNVEATFACDPWEQQGGYLKRCHGLELLLKLENPFGHRVQQLTARGNRPGETQTIDVAFLGEQAVPAHVGTNRRAIGLSAVEALAQHIRAHTAVTPALRGNIRVV